FRTDLHTSVLPRAYSATGSAESSITTFRRGLMTGAGTTLRYRGQRRIVPVIEPVIVPSSLVRPESRAARNRKRQIFKPKSLMGDSSSACCARIRIDSFGCFDGRNLFSEAVAMAAVHTRHSGRCRRNGIHQIVGEPFDFAGAREKLGRQPLLQQIVRQLA